MTMPSNSSHQYYPDNTMTDFTTKLASTVELTGEWLVGISEIMLPKNWNTLPEEGLCISANCSNCPYPPYTGFPLENISNAELREKMLNVSIHLYNGHFTNMEDLAHELNAASYNAFSTPSDYNKPTPYPPEFRYKKVAKRIIITVDAGMVVKFPPVLETILGLSPKQNPVINNSNAKLTIVGDFACDLQAGIHSLYVYSDISHYIPVGDIKAPLLRVVSTSGNAGTVITRYYEHVRYVPVQKKSFDSIHITIRDDFGNKILFKSGKVLLTLHFKRATIPYLL
jgi:nitrogen fixation protein